MPDIFDLLAMPQVKGIYPATRIALNDGTDPVPPSRSVFRVSRDNIDNADPECESNCALARAMDEQINEPTARSFCCEVFSRHAVVTYVERPRDGNARDGDAPDAPRTYRQYWRLSPRAAKFVYDHAAGRPVEPCQLSMTTWDYGYLMVPMAIDRYGPCFDAEDLISNIPAKEQPNHERMRDAFALCEQESFVEFDPGKGWWIVSEDGRRELERWREKRGYGCSIL